LGVVILPPCPSIVDANYFRRTCGPPHEKEQNIHGYSLRRAVGCANVGEEPLLLIS
jgi:hypothetical protein